MVGMALWGVIGPALTAGAPPAAVHTAVAFDGGKIECDGDIYHFRAASGVEMLDVWVPPVPVVRGLLLSGNPGGIGGDERPFTRDPGFRTFAARFGFGLLGLHSFPGGRIYGTTGKVILRALDDFAKIGKHPELSNVPFIPLGNSNGGSTSYGFVNFVPERVVCFAMNVGSMRSPASPTDGALQVPGFICVGPRDPILQSLEATRASVKAARGKDARWCWLAEQNKGHEVGRIFDYQMAFFENCLYLRLPDLKEPGGDPRQGPVRLKPLPLESGWLVDHSSWESGLVRIAPYTQYDGDHSLAGWVPDEDCAVLYRGLATYNNPIKLRIKNLPDIINPNASGRFLTSMGGPVVNVGDRVTLEADLTGFPGWKSLTFFDRSKKIGEFTGKGETTSTIAYTVPATRVIHSFTVLAADADGKQRTATPVYLIVRDPALKLELPQKTLDTRHPPKQPKPGAAPISAKELANPLSATARDLIAYGLTPAQERQFHAGSGKIAAFWQKITGDNSAIHIPADNTKGVRPAMLIKAAYSRAGLYLYFEVTDGSPTGAPLKSDAFWASRELDVMLDSRSVDDFWKPPTTESFINAAWSISMTTVQLQASMTANSPKSLVRMNFVDPFEFRYYLFSLHDLEKARGIKFNQQTPAPDKRVVEWFVPWSSVGKIGLASAPAYGARLAFYPGYNVNEPGGQMKNLRMESCPDPWGLASFRARNDSWGSLLFGPILKD